MTAPDDRVLRSARRGLGELTLNRPEALNALSIDMIDALAAALFAWRDDPEVRAVVLRGAGERGLCAGGDVRALAEHIRAGEPEQVRAFFRREYALNAAIAAHPAPIIALADGVTMGGGVGLAGHAAVRIVTERSVVAMPETRIGLTPDVGGSWLCAHAPGRLGEYLALTGATMDAADAIFAGFADVFVPSARLDELRLALGDAADAADVAVRGDASAAAPNPGRPLDRAAVLEAVMPFAADPGPASLAAAREWIDPAFAADTVGEIALRLRADGRAEASACADALATLSPTSLAVTLAAVRRARELPNLRAALEQEYGLVLWFADTQPDLVEGIRAQLIDKDRAPRWMPPTLAALSPAVADAALSYRPTPALWS
ncbi:MAG: enoyl-CoA hydratase/isomerase family protein [Microbacteriaceae bacterium]|jgi:enoyl-CoA hydratase|nr:enoyl-CoA hydratase/isomerase family protein [Microbacteriaceae bacterium]HPZ34690.1 enoyl-CoA hydratase/isomerase family protein [Microbacteriaceae bacterium]HQC92524.1 enoyl-CoA hydratase/isomerase family protein [Microbacteriaceae bacterium]